MEDIAPKLLERIKGDFEKEFSSDTSVAEIYKKINEGTATYLDANEFSIRAGEIFFRMDGCITTLQKSLWKIRLKIITG